MKPVWTHLELAKSMEAKGQKQAVKIIAKSCFRLMKLKKTLFADSVL